MSPGAAPVTQEPQGGWSLSGEAAALPEQPGGFSLAQEAAKETSSVGSVASNLGRQAVLAAATSGKTILDAPINLAKAGLDLLDWAGFGVRSEGQLGHMPLEGVDSVTLLSKIPGAAPEAKIRETLGQAGPVAEGIGRTMGNVLSFAAGGGTGLVKAAGLPGKAVEVLGAPGYTLGKELIERFPEALKWVAKNPNLLPATAAASTGFGLYNLVSTEGGLPERTAAMGHGLVLGAGIHVLGELGKVVNSATLRALLSPEELKAMDEVVQGTRTSGEVSISALKRIPGRVLQAAMEGTGFAAMDPSWFHDVAKGLNGDKEAGLRAAAEWFGSWGGSLAAHVGNPGEAFPFQNRADPATRQWYLQWLGEQQQAAAERAAKSAAEEAARPAQERQAYREGVAADAAQTQRAFEGVRKLGQGAEPVTLHNAPTLDALFQAGWSASDVQPEHVEMEFPGAKVKVSTLGDLHTPEGEAALQDLVLRSLRARMIGHAVFDPIGMHQSESGHWLAPDMSAYSIDLDGKIRRRAEPGEPWKEAGEPTLPADGPLAADPAVQRWRQFIQSMDKIAAPSPARETLHAAIESAAKGDPNSPSVNELMQFLHSVPPEQLEPHLTADNLPAIAMEIGRLGAGTETANQAMAEIGRSLQPREGVIQGKEGDQALREGEPASGDTETGRPDERGAVLLSGAGAKIGSRLGAKVREYYEQGRHLAAQFFENQPTELENLTRGTRAEAVGKEVADTVRRAIDLGAKNEGDLRKPLKAVLRIRAGTIRWLDELVDNGHGGQDTRFRLLTENNPLPNGETPTKAAVDAINRLRALESAAGSQAAAAGAMRPSRTSPGDYEPFQARPADQISVLPRLPGEGWLKVVGDASLRKQLAEAIARGSTARTGRQFDAAKIEEQLRQAVESRDPTVKEAAFESFRELPYMPSAITDAAGATHRVLETSFLDTAHRIARTQPVRSALIKEIGQDLPERYMQPDRPGLVGTLEKLSKAGANQETVDFARRMLENAGGLSRQPDWLATPVGKAVTGLSWLADMGGLRRAAQVFNAFSFDPLDPLTAAGAYGGYVRLFRALVDAGLHPIEAFKGMLGEMERAGSFIADNSNLTREVDIGSKTRGLSAQIRRFLSLPGRLSEQAKARGYDLMAKQMIEDWKAGKNYGKWDDLTLAVTGFDKAQAKQMIEGSAPPELYDRFRSEFVRGATGDYRPGEGSALRDSTWFNKVFAYQRFFMGRMRQVNRLTSQFWRRPDLSFQTGSRLGGMILGSALAGNFGAWLAYQFRGLSTEDFLREIKYAPQAAVWNTLSQLYGGVAGTAIRALFQGTGKPEQFLTQLSPLTSVTAAALDAGGKWKSGEQSFAESLLGFANSIGLMQPVKIPRAAGMALHLIASKEVEDAKSRFYAWKRQEGLPIDTGSSADIPFTLDKRTIDEALRSALDDNKDIFKVPEIDQAVRQALTHGTGQQVADSIAAKSPLLDADVADPRQRAKLESFVGPERMKTLYRYDQALQLIAERYRDEEGAPKNTESSFTQRMLEAGHQTSLGDHRLLKGLIHEVSQREGVRLLMDMPPSGQSGQLATTIYDHPEAWPDIFTPLERAMLTDPGQLSAIHFILDKKAMDAAVARQDKGGDQELKTEVRKLEATGLEQGTVPTPAPGTAPRLRSPLR